MSNPNFRNVLLPMCLEIYGIPVDATEDDVLKCFQGSKKAHFVEPTGQNQNSKWLLLCENSQVYFHYLYNQQQCNYNGQPIQVLQCSVPCDIPNEWEEIAKQFPQNMYTGPGAPGGPGHFFYPGMGYGQPFGYPQGFGNAPSMGDNQQQPEGEGAEGGHQVPPNMQQYPQFPQYPPGFQPMWPPYSMPQGYNMNQGDPPPYSSGPRRSSDNTQGADPREGYSSATIEADQKRKIDELNRRKPSTDESSSSSSEEEEESEPEKEKPSGMIKVTKIPPKVTEDTLTYFFENRRKSGGGDIEELDYNKEERTAIITFEDPAAVDRVLQKLPILLEGVQIHVEQFVPDNFHDENVAEENNSLDTKPSCTVKVEGVQAKTTSDTVQYYFESKRAAGVPVDVEKFEEKMEGDDEDERVFYVTFSCEEDMKKVLSRPHKVDGKPLTVTEYIPPPPPKPRPLYEDKVLVKGLSLQTSKDGLENFIEAKTGATATDLLYGEEDGVVLISFEEPPDFEKLQNACKKRSLDGCYLHVQRVPISNCIKVNGISPKTSSDTVQYYFENPKRSGGGDVEKVMLNEEGGFCLVYFEDHTVIDGVCKRKHIIDGSTLQVQLFHDMLGEATTAEEGPKFKVPDPVVVTDIDKRKVQFLLCSNVNKEALDKELKSAYTQILWPSEFQGQLKLECLLTKDVKDCRQLVKTWKKSSTESLNKFLDALAVHKIEVLQSIWPNVMTELQSLKITHPDGVAVAVEKVSFEIFVMGHKQFAEDLAKQIQVIIKATSDDLDRKKQQVTESIQVKHHQLMFLSFSHFSDEMEKKFKDMKVKLDFKKKQVVFNGVATEVTAAKVAMLEITSNLEHSKIPKFSQRRFKFLQNADVKKYIVQKMKDKNVTGVWEMEGDSLVVYATNDQDAVTAAHVVRDSVVETPIHVKPEASQLLMSDSFDAKMDEIKKTSQCFIDIQNDANAGKVVIFSTDLDAGNIRELVETFLTDNTIYEKEVDLPDGIMRHVTEQKKTEIEKIAKDLESDQVQIICRGRCITIKGTELGLNKAQQRIDQLVQRIERKQHTIDKPGITTLMKSDTGKGKVAKVERDTGVTISSSDDSDDGDQMGGAQRGKLVQEIALCSAKHYKIHCVMGDIIECDVDVLVNAANKDLQHIGGLAKAIVEKGGRSIQNECSDYVKRKGRLMEGDIFCSKPGNLQCKAIIHAVGPVWQDGKNQEEELLREAVFKSMETSSEKNMSSIAFPALGAGIFGVPARLAIKTIIEAVRDFYKENKRSSVSDVYLCDVKMDLVNLFIDNLKKTYGADKVTQTQNSAGGYRWKTTQSHARPQRYPPPEFSDERKGGGMSAGIINTKVHKGQIAKMKVDMIVNTTSKDLKLSNGAVSNSLLQAAGLGIQAECSQKFPDGINSGDVAITDGHNLRCKVVAHGSLPGWDGGAMALQILQKFMLNCLQKANKHRCSDVAFPAMGTGNLGYPKDIVAKEMFRIVSQYSAQNPDSSVTDVYFVVYDKDHPTVKAFLEAERTAKASHQYRGGGAEGGIQRNMERQSRQFGSQVAKNPDDVMSSEDQLVLDVGSLQLKIYQGDITMIDVETIVNSTNEEFDLTRGNVSKLLNEKGGEDHKQQVKLQVKTMKKEGIAVTTMDPKKTGMACQNVIHLNVDDDKKDWKTIFIMALKKAEEISSKSVAFPAMGTAGLQRKPSDIAVSFIDALVEFEHSRSKDTDEPDLKEVHLVIFQPEMLQIMVKAMEDHIKNASKSKSAMKKLYDYFIKKTSHGSGSKDDDKKTNKPMSWNPRKIKNDKKTNSYTFIVYGDSQEIISRAIQSLEDSLDKDFKAKEFRDKVIKEFSNTQENKVNSLREKHDVDVVVDKRVGRIVLHGLQEHIYNASDDVHKILREAESKRQAECEAKLISDMVQWFFIEVTGQGQDLQKYPPEVNRVLEKAYRNQQDKATFNDNSGNKYVVDLNSYEEFPETNPKDAVKVIRRNLMADSTMDLPEHWTKMADKDNVSVVPLQPTDQEFVTVKQNFLQTVGNPKNVIKVERIQNRLLYQQYVAKKKLMDTQNPSGTQNERFLWHGTAPNAIDSINTHGFNRSYCGKNAVAYGNGVYFAVNSQYSAQKHYSVPDASGNQRMYQCKVLTGEFTKGAGGMRVPPQKQQGASHVLFDSVVDNPVQPGIFVIFNDTQAYPEYLITYQ